MKRKCILQLRVYYEYVGTKDDHYSQRAAKTKDDAWLTHRRNPSDA